MRSLSETPEQIKPFVFHGVEIPDSGKSGDCPFCDKPGHFSVLKDTGQFRCVRCELTGNVYSFLQTLYNESLARTTPADYAALAEERGVPDWAIQEFGLVVSSITGEWLVPAYNLKGTLANLYRYTDIDGPSSPKRLLGTPGCQTFPFGTQLLLKSQKERKVTEGLFDTIALYSMLASTRKRNGKLVACKQGTPGSLLEKVGVLGVPGAGTFKDDWAVYLNEMDTDLIYDNDHPKRDEKGNIRLLKGKPIMPGWDGMQRATQILNNGKYRPKSLRQILWTNPQGDSPTKDYKGYDPELPDGFDVRDVRTKLGNIIGLEWLENRLYSVEVEDANDPDEVDDNESPVEPIPCSSYEELAGHYAAHIHMSQELRDTLLVALTVVFSSPIDGEGLWFRIIGPPGSGKTTLAEAISAAREYVFPTSIVTGFHSGYVGVEPPGIGKTKKKDSSLIPRMNGKCTIIKDADPLIQSSKRAEILSEMRDFYDGTSRVNYRNRVSNNYEDIKTTFLLCGTDVLRSLDSAFLGERFLVCEIMARGANTRPFLDRASSNAKAKVFASLALKHETADTEDNELDVHDDKATFLKQVTYGYLQMSRQALGHRNPPTYGDWEDSVTTAISEFVGVIRARVERTGHDMLYRPREELATRLTGQFTKLAICVAFMLNKPSVDAEVIRILRKVGKDTAESFQMDIATLLYKYPQGIGLATICRELRLPETSVRRFLNDMMEFDSVCKVKAPNKSGQRGRDLHLWALSDRIRNLYKLAFIEPHRSQKRPIDSTSKADTRPTPKPTIRRKPLAKDRMNGTPEPHQDAEVPNPIPKSARPSSRIRSVSRATSPSPPKSSSKSGTLRTNSVDTPNPKRRPVAKR